MTEKFDHVIMSDYETATCYNGYKVFDDHAELYIISTDKHEDRDIIIFDIELLQRLLKLRWRKACQTRHNKSVSDKIYFTIISEKHPDPVKLSHYILNITSPSIMVKFRNGNQNDYRRSNLIAIKRNNSMILKMYFTRPTGITAIDEEYQNNVLYSFAVTYKSSDKGILITKKKYFLIKKYDTVDRALNAAIAFRRLILNYEKKVE